MRVTLQMTSMRSIYNVNNNSASLYDLYTQISSEHSVLTPSDNPSAATSAISDTAVIEKYNAYISNIESADTFLGLSDNALSDVNTILTSAKTIAVDMSSGNNTSSMFNGSLSEMTELLSSLVATGNSNYSGQYLFGGTDNSEDPFEIIDNKYVYFKGNNDDLEISTANNTYTAMNTTANNAFGNLDTTISSNKLERALNISNSYSTPLADLNSGEGVADGSITIYYSSSTSVYGGLTINLSDADTLSDVATYIEQASIAKADSYESTDPEYNYVLHVGLNENKTGLEITQIDRTTGLTVDLDTDATASPIIIKETEVARNLGISGNGSTAGNSTLQGNDLDPIITNTTLISDITNWDTDSFSIYNGSENNSVSVISTGDATEYFSSWQLSGLSDGGNITDDEKMYYAMIDLGSGDWQVNIYNNENKNSNSLIATGISNGGLLSFEEVNNSGVTGTVSFAPLASSTDPIDGVLTIDYPTSYGANISVSDFKFEGTSIGASGINTDEIITDLNIYGLEDGTTTDTSGDFEISIEYTPSGAYQISVINDGNTMLTGELQGANNGRVELTATSSNYENLSGNITLDCPSSIMTSGTTYIVSANATFNTVEDITNAINSSNTYTTSQISKDGKSIEVSSQLCGAYLTIAQNYSGANISGDNADQLSCLDLNGIVAGVNSDEDGKLYSTISENSTAGTYTVEFYSDPEKSELVARAESTNSSGEIQITAIEGSGISGKVYLSYSADDADIEISSSALVSSNDKYHQLSQIDLTGLVAGQNCGYSGELYFEVEDSSGTYQLRAYSDSEHESLVASGSITGNGIVTMNEENYSGISGSLYLDYNSNTSDIIVQPESSDLSGRDLEQNIFATFSCIIDALESEDCYAVNDQLDNINTDLTRILSSRATIGSKQEFISMLSARHTSNIDILKANVSSAIDVDLVQAATDYSMQKTAYEASLSATTQLMSVSLLDYI